MVKPLHSVIDKVYRMANLVKASAKVALSIDGLDQTNGAYGDQIVKVLITRDWMLIVVELKLLTRLLSA